MNHFILTRFNLKLWWEHDKNGKAIQTEEWLEERFRLFDIYCWTSVRNQTCQLFKWICLLDADTPERFKRRVEGYHERWEGFLPFYLNENETKHFQQFFQKKCWELSDKKDPELLTTYLDNDDSLREDYVERVQRYVKKVEYGTVFTFRYGLQYYEELNLAVRVPYDNNHFLSYYEELNDSVKTIWGFWHYSIFTYSGIRVITINNPKNPMWIETIHRGNIDNDVKMTWSQKLQTRQNSLQRYGIDRKLLLPSKSYIVFVFRFIPRMMAQVIRRMSEKVKSAT